MTGHLKAYAIQRLGTTYALTTGGGFTLPRYNLLHQQTSPDGPVITEYVEGWTSGAFAAMVVRNGLNQRLRRERRGAWLVVRAVAVDPPEDAGLRHQAQRLHVDPLPGPWFVRPGRELGRALDDAEATPISEQLRVCGFRPVAVTDDGSLEFLVGEEVVPGWILRHDVTSGTVRVMVSQGPLEEWIDQPKIEQPWDSHREARHGDVFRGGLDDLVVAHKTSHGDEPGPVRHFHSADGRIVASHEANRKTYVTFLGPGYEAPV